MSTITDLTDVFIELHVDDFQTAIDFYKMIGFEVVWLSDEYLVMKKGKSVINFYPGDDRAYDHSYFGQFPRDTKRGYAVEIILFVDDIKSFYEKMKDKLNVVKPLELKRWGQWDFRIEDPFGFYIRFTEPYSWLDNKEMISKTKEIAEKKKLVI